MIMLERNGLYAAIADVLDDELMELNGGGLREARVLIHRVMEGDPVEAEALPEKEKNYVKTARVLMGDALYSHAWLET